MCLTAGQLTEALGCTLSMKLISLAMSEWSIGLFLYDSTVDMVNGLADGISEAIVSTWQIYERLETI